MVRLFAMVESYSSKWVALLDCNSFYASCERVFRPDLIGKPIMVLSNNDGCIVAQSPEAKIISKQLGISRGAPFFEVKELLLEKGVHIFSSNYTLYQDLSNRIMKILAEEAVGELQIYSIDEAFLLLAENWNGVKEIEDYFIALIKKVRRETGIPLSVGVARTKTLAKSANHFAKERANAFYHLIETEEEGKIASLPVGEIWGIGRRKAASMAQRGIVRVRDLLEIPDEHIKKRWTLSTLRTVLELRGERVALEEEEGKRREAIVSSRSFAKPTASLSDILDSIATYCEIAVGKLVAQASFASEVWVFLGESRFCEGHYRASLTKRLARPSDSLPEILGVAKELASQLFKEGKRFNKTGVGLYRLSHKAPEQLELFISKTQEFKQRQAAVASHLVKLNQKSNTPLVRPLSCIPVGDWSMCRNYLSPRYTTCWEELPPVK